jgi:hypothetical protein
MQSGVACRISYQFQFACLLGETPTLVLDNYNAMSRPHLPDRILMAAFDVIGNLFSQRIYRTLVGS